MIAIVDYGAGNIFSVKNALDYLGFENKLTNKTQDLIDADAIILPGVGAFPWAMKKLEESGLVDTIKEQSKLKPFLGICAGMQCLSGMYSDTEPRMSLISGGTHDNGGKRYSHTVEIMDNTKLKAILQQDNILTNSSHKYQVNPPLRDDIVISAYSEDGTIEGVELPDKKFIIGTQWHPEYILDENSMKIFRAFVDSL